MIINPFQMKERKEEDLQKVDSHVIQQYIITHYMDYLQKDLKEELIVKIKELLVEKYHLSDVDKQTELIHQIINKMFGYDILQKYIDMPDVSDIRAVAFNRIYIKRLGKWSLVDTKFTSNEEFEEYIRYCVIKNSANINFDNPKVVVSDKKYNLRIEAGIQPVNQMSASIAIRIHRPNIGVNLETLLLYDEMLDACSYQMILNLINSQKNVILAGKGGSGKTTLLRAMIDKYPEDVSMTINEETTELYIENKNSIQREVIENREDNKKITLEKLLKNSLVLSNDMIVTGEIKGSEASVFLDAVSTGHIGLATVHSNCAENTIDRLVMLYKRDIKAQQYSEQFVEQLIASSIDYIIYLKDYQVVEIMEVNYSKQDEKVLLESIYKR